MPTPIIQYQPQTQVIGARNQPYADAPRITQSRVGEILQQGVDKLGTGISQFEAARARDAAERENETARAWSASALSKARLDWSTQLVERQSKAEPNATDFTPNLMKDYGDYATKLLESAPSRKAKAFLTERLEEFRVSLGTQALTFEAQARIDYRNDLFNQGIQNTQKLMNTAPEQYKEALAEQVALIDSSALPPLKKSELRQKAIDNISSAAVWSQMQKNPAGFLNSIGFGIAADGKTRRTTGDLQGVTGNEAFDALPYEKRVQLFGQAVTMRAQMEADAAAAVKQKQMEASDEVAKQGWNMIFTPGKLSQARNYIEQNKQVLHAPVYHSLLSAIRSEERHNMADARAAASVPQRSDPAAFRDIQRLILDNKPEEAARLSFMYHQNGRLSNEHLAVSVSTAQAIEKENGPRNPYQRGRAYIAQAMDPGPLVQDPLGRSRMANALDAFDTWVKSGKRTDEEIEKQSKSLVDQYRFINFGDTVMSLPRPSSYDMPRVGTPAVIEQAAAQAGIAAKRRFERKELNESEYKAEIATINRWREAVRRAGGAAAK